MGSSPRRQTRALRPRRDRDEYPSGDGNPLRDPSLFPAKLQANSAPALVYVAQAIGGGFWAKTLLPGSLPLAAAGFLGWVFVKSLQAAPAAQIWSLVGVVVVGPLLMLAARFVLRSSFFGTQRESDQSQAEVDAEPGRSRAAAAPGPDPAAAGRLSCPAFAAHRY